ncbi:hypothetical protein GCM10008944_27290 [Cytobacillus oceanisediminis]
MEVRDAEVGDAPTVTALLEQLGYVRTSQALAHHIATAHDRDDAAWVAVTSLGGAERIVGFAAAHRFRPFELDAPVAELTALIIDHEQRRLGCGRVLVSRFEEWATSNGCIRTSVATSFSRREAHRFYEALGYEQLARKYEKNI